jgi:hypothetical protein
MQGPAAGLSQALPHCNENLSQAGFGRAQTRCDPTLSMLSTSGLEIFSAIGVAKSESCPAVLPHRFRTMPLARFSS